MDPLIKARLQQHNTLINIINKNQSKKDKAEEPKQKKTNTWGNLLGGGGGEDSK